MSNQKNNKKINIERKENASKIVSLGHTPNNWVDAFSKFIADLSGVVDHTELKKRKHKYD